MTFFPHCKYHLILWQLLLLVTDIVYILIILMLIGLPVFLAAIKDCLL